MFCPQSALVVHPPFDEPEEAMPDPAEPEPGEVMDPDEGEVPPSSVPQ
jgi:hypothetical protein